ncbi:oxidoreductase [Cryptococcus deuterogattii 99/473]|uniref:Oxidoreductase n=1 Tax=Cryptococcus deuterogattii Ram5 TaxID=1296110 RepID=A0A0D0T0F0_9TREE|nr:oxidoreductase [Cryptococcus deuterogattii LA55]KIR39072.1 oxidoreductase [Cryptococcus deuterogattii Ram5]KIR96044.1 oxidoreductase [Cryptococcus deuterogattii CBS 10090]KIY58987.1 oxidoreductase [Cryptococcus deuterogattii 99/473]
MSLPYTVASTVHLPPATISKLQDTFTSFIHRTDPSSPFTKEELSKIQIFFTTGRGPPVDSLADVPNLELVQLCSAGADKAISSPAMKAYVEERKRGKGKGDSKEVKLATASGTHVLSIPNYVVAMVITLLHQLPRQIIGARTEKRWLSEAECDMDGQAYYARKTFQRTAGLLGYGSLGRETARLLKAHGMRIIAANTSGKATPQDGYIIPGTGDKDGSIPEAFYSTKDPKSVKEFLNQCDVLVASLPNTPDTQHFLNKEKLEMLPKGAVLVNVGRGSLIPSARLTFSPSFHTTKDDLLAVLDTPHIFGAALDVTEPEPLPDGHPLWSHPKCIITPHLSGNTEGEMEIAADVLVYNVERMKDGKGVVNEVKWERGY